MLSILLYTAIPLEPENILQVARGLVAEENFNKGTFANTLGITLNESLQGYDTLRCVMLMLMMWEKQHKCKATRGLLANILKKDYNDIATRLALTY